MSNKKVTIEDVFSKLCALFSMFANYGKSFNKLIAGLAELTGAVEGAKVSTNQHIKDSTEHIKGSSQEILKEIRSLNRGYNELNEYVKRIDIRLQDQQQNSLSARSKDIENIHNRLDKLEGGIEAIIFRLNRPPFYERWFNAIKNLI